MSSGNQHPTPPADRQSLAGKYLTFALGREGYGIDILRVKEIIGIMPITALPHLPPYMKGVINLRGRVIPIMDLRSKFAMAPQAYTSRTCIVVAEVTKNAARVPVGVVVDEVAEVAHYAAEEIEPPPSMGTGPQHLLGVAKRNGQVRILLDIDRIVNSDEVVALAEAA